MSHRIKIPVIAERLTSFQISELKKVGFFQKGDEYREMPVTIKRGHGLGETVSNIQIAVSTQEGNSYIRLSYSLDGEPINYLMPLVRLKSNLGKGGWLWYCLCPTSNRRCRKLFLYEKQFVGIRAIENGFYLKQLIPVSRRGEFKLMTKVNNCERIISGRAKKYFMSHYDGSLTKRQLRVMKAKDELDRLSLVLQ